MSLSAIFELIVTTKLIGEKICGQL